MLHFTGIWRGWDRGWVVEKKDVSHILVVNWRWPPIWKSMAEPCTWIQWLWIVLRRMEWDGMGHDGMESPLDCTGLARCILDGWTSLFCWLVWILLPSEHIITQRQCQLYLKPGMALIKSPARTPIQPIMFKVWGPTTVPHFCVCVWVCVSEILCMRVSRCVSAPSPCPCARDCYHVKKKKWKKTVDLFSVFFLSKIMSTVLTNTCTVLYTQINRLVYMP